MQCLRYSARSQRRDNAFGWSARQRFTLPMARDTPRRECPSMNKVIGVRIQTALLPVASFILRAARIASHVRMLLG